MAQNERDTQRMIELLDEGRHWAALWVAMRPGPREVAFLIAALLPWMIWILL